MKDLTKIIIAVALHAAVITVSTRGAARVARAALTLLREGGSCSRCATPHSLLQGGDGHAGRVGGPVRCKSLAAMTGGCPREELHLQGS